MLHLRFSSSAPEGGYFPAESSSASSSQNQSPTTEFWEVSPPAGKSLILYCTFAISRLCAWGGTFQPRLGPAHRTRSTRDSISGAFSPWGEGFYLGHSSACASVLRAAGVSAPYVTPAISELFVWGTHFAAESVPAFSGQKPLKEKQQFFMLHLRFSSSAPEGGYFPAESSSAI